MAGARLRNTYNRCQIDALVWAVVITWNIEHFEIRHSSLPYDGDLVRGDHPDQSDDRVTQPGRVRGN